MAGKNPSSFGWPGITLAFLLRASEAPPAILGPSGAAKRLPGRKNRIFLKLAPLISELLLGRPWASSLSFPGVPDSPGDL